MFVTCQRGAGGWGGSCPVCSFATLLSVPPSILQLMSEPTQLVWFGTGGDVPWLGKSPKADADR